jgi:hypothetical protein
LGHIEAKMMCKFRKFSSLCSSSCEAGAKTVIHLSTELITLRPGASTELGSQRRRKKHIFPTC